VISGTRLRDLPPTLDSFGQPRFGRSLTALRHNRNDGRGAKFDCFSHDKIHHVGCDDRLHQRHRVRRFALDRVERADAHRDGALVDARNRCCKFSAAAGEERQRIADAHPQRLRDMPRCLAWQIQLAPLICGGQRWRAKESRSMHR
jgi:hypothetical protein